MRGYLSYGMTQVRPTGIPTLESVLRDLEETLAELEWRATATYRTVAERTKDLEAADAIRNAIEALRCLQADEIPN
jgi:hypothetical protein